MANDYDPNEATYSGQARPLDPSSLPCRLRAAAAATRNEYSRDEADQLLVEAAEKIEELEGMGEWIWR